VALHPKRWAPSPKLLNAKPKPEKVREHQRFNPIHSWGNHFILGDPDRLCWVTTLSHGVLSCVNLKRLTDIEAMEAPAGFTWVDGEWEASSWEYAFNFVEDEAAWGPDKTMHSHVRRREWSRRMTARQDPKESDMPHVYQLYIEAEWDSEAKLRFEHKFITATLSEVYAKLNICLTFEFKRLNTGSDAELKTLGVPNLSKLSMSLPVKPTILFKATTNSDSFMSLNVAKFLNPDIVNSLVFNLFPMCFYDADQLANEERQLKHMHERGMRRFASLHGYCLLSVIEGRWDTALPQHLQQQTVSSPVASTTEKIRGSFSLLTSGSFQVQEPTTASKGLWYARLCRRGGGTDSSISEVDQTKEVLMQHASEQATWHKTFAIPHFLPALDLSGASSAEGARGEESESWSIHLCSRSSAAARGGVLWSEELDEAMKQGREMLAWKSSVWLNALQVLPPVSHHLRPSQAQSSIMAVVRQVPLEMRGVGGVKVGSSLSSWLQSLQASKQQHTADPGAPPPGVLLVSPMSCTNLDEKLYARFKVMVCVGEDRRQALESKWSSPMFANYSEEGKNVVYNRFNPTWDDGEVLVFHALAQPLERLRVCVEVWAEDKPVDSKKGEEKHDEKKKKEQEEHKEQEGHAAEAGSEQAGALYTDAQMSKETRLGQAWFSLNSLVAVGRSFTPPPAVHVEAEGQQKEGEQQQQARAAGGEQEEVVAFCTPVDLVQRRLGPLIKTEPSWKHQFCSVMLAYRPQAQTLGVARLVIRLEALLLPRFAHSAEELEKHLSILAKARIALRFGRHVQQAQVVGGWSNWQSGCPVLMVDQVHETHPHEQLSMAFRENSVAVFDLTLPHMVDPCPLAPPRCFILVIHRSHTIHHHPSSIARTPSIARASPSHPASRPLILLLLLPACSPAPHHHRPFLLSLTLFCWFLAPPFALRARTIPRSRQIAS
jgi:hypothetical protein